MNDFQVSSNLSPGIYQVQARANTTAQYQGQQTATGAAYAPSPNTASAPSIEHAIFRFGPNTPPPGIENLPFRYGEEDPTGAQFVNTNANAADTFPNQKPDDFEEEKADKANAKPVKISDESVKDMVNEGKIKFVVKLNGDLIVCQHTKGGSKDPPLSSRERRGRANRRASGHCTRS